MNFLNSLNASELRALRSVANERIFARGARLIREGEQAEYVMVILGGRTRITVKADEGALVLAELGPGQLVGERAALRVSVRSATVTALETVRALVMRTEDFASFISAHPRVLDIVEDQIYERLTEDPIGYADSGVPESFPTPPASASFRSAGDLLVGEPREALAPEPWPVPGRERVRSALSGENCTVIMTDVVGFCAECRDDHDRQIIREASLEMMRSSLGLLWGQCVSKDLGDGLLVIVPPPVTTARVMELLHRDLPGELRLHNRTYAEPAHIRLRMAADVGPITHDSVGVSGDVIIRVSRLLDAPALRDPMATSGVGLGVIVSEFVYGTAIKVANGWTDPDSYRKVEARVKESRIPAWIRLIDTAAPPPRARDPRARSGPDFVSRARADAAAAIPPLVRRVRKRFGRGGLADGREYGGERLCMSRWSAK